MGCLKENIWRRQKCKKSIKRAKLESLRGKFDDMKLEEGETVAQYVARIEEVVSAIRGVDGLIDDDTILIKVIRTLLPIYAIRVSAIQELRCILENDLTLEVLVGRLTAFELSNFDNYKPENIESAFKAKLSLKDFEETRQKKKKGKVKHVSSNSDIDEEDIEQLEALLARRFHRGKSKFKVTYYLFQLQ